MSEPTEAAGDRRIWLVAGAAVVGLAVWAALSASSAGDYGNPRCARWACDDASRPLHALVTGHLGAFFKTQTAMGLTSLLLRAPAVAIAHAWGAGTLGEYRAGALVCLVVAAVVGTLLAARTARRGVPVPVALALLTLWAAAIAWGRSVYFGHPEEPLAAALALLAIVLALERRALHAGIVLGLAIGTKQWALLAAPVALTAIARSEWRRLLVAALAVAAVTLGVPAIGSPSTFKAAQQATARGDDKTTTPADVWFRLGRKHVFARTRTTVAYGVYPPKLIGRWIRTFVFALAVAASVVFVRRRGIATADTLGLVALLFLLRAVLDTQTFSYHLTPMLMAIAAWEGLGRRRLPVVACLALAAFELTVHYVAPDMSANAFNAIFLAWTLPLAAYLAVSCLGSAGPARSRSARFQTAA